MEAYYYLFKERGKKMKKLLVASLAIIGGLGVCTTTPAAITGSKHDFTSTNWAGGQICLPCHAPHNNKNATGELLWNHDMSSVTNYELYSSPTFDANGTGALNTVTLTPSGISKFCLSCHDGTVALDAYGNHVSTSGTITGNANLGTKLSDDHPVSFLYDATLATTDGGLVSPANLPAEIRLFDGKMECASCHDVHNKHTLPALLNVSNDGSGLCLSCHTK